ncbi:restriction endonuclease [Thauera aromatica]|uniref:Mrr restriction system protein n=1 Tax=Thauera aromatica K172 TaxID=44139 RepID=A0A2R4BKT6_THAAR|nr:restriction endonuclease [Thauera aromatica]AVR87824.1 Mrr restriction system protein [Thauera aromatica K172]
MSVPKYHELMRPLLDLIADGRARNLREASQELAERLALTDEDLAEILPSGHSRYLNRVGWAKSGLNKTGLIESCGRGLFRISEKGCAALPDLPFQLDRKYFETRGMGSWKAVASPDPDAPGISLGAEPDETLTPEEQIDETLAEIQEALEQEVLTQLRSINPASFERFVVRLLAAMGYGVGEVTGRSGDGGIDGVIYEDRLKLDRIYLQAKRWADAPVGGPDINGFLGALAKHGANRGVFVTTSRFTQDARRAVELPHLRLVLIDGEELARLAVEHNVGVSLKRRIELKRLDSDFFDDL